MSDLPNPRSKSEDATQPPQLAHRHCPRWGAWSWVHACISAAAVFSTDLSGMARRRLADCSNAAEPRMRPVKSYLTCPKLGDAIRLLSRHEDQNVPLLGSTEPDNSYALPLCYRPDV
jgi:hypothetical protein